MTGRPDILANVRADRVRTVRGLSGRPARKKHGQFLVEGPQGVRELVRWAPAQVRDLYLTEDAADRYPEIVEAARAARLHVHLGTREVLDAMSPDAQGVLAVAHSAGPTTTPEPAGVLAPGGRGPGLLAVLVRVNDPGNAGTVIRAADAAGADAVVLGSGSVELLSPKVVRSTAGSLFHLPVLTGTDVADTLNGLRAAGVQVLAADGHGEWDLDDLADRAAARSATANPSDPGLAPGTTTGTGPTDGGAPDLTAPTAWVFGNEAHGLTADELALCDAAVRVPIHGRAESLNLATAATVCLYASARARRRAAG